MLKNSLKHVTLSQNHMATTFHFTLSVPKNEIGRAQRCLKASHELVAQYEKSLSEFLVGSPIYEWNHSSLEKKPILTGHALKLLEISKTLEEITDRAFSPHAKGNGISFGAIGKGYALDGVREEIESYGFKDYLLSAGGSSLLVSGFSSPRVPWTVGWSIDGRKVALPLTHTSGFALAMGISGTSDKGNHLLDPLSGKSVTHAKSAFVSLASATYADALSTALFVSGWEKAITTFSQLTDKPAIALVNLSDEIYWNGTFEKQWGRIA